MVTIRAEFQEVINMLRRLKGSIQSGNEPDELDGEVEDIMDKLFDAMKKLPD